MRHRMDILSEKPFILIGISSRYQSTEFLFSFFFFSLKMNYLNKTSEFVHWFRLNQIFKEKKKQHIYGKCKKLCQISIHGNIKFVGNSSCLLFAKFIEYCTDISGSGKFDFTYFRRSIEGEKKRRISAAFFLTSIDATILHILYYSLTESIVQL